jgi:hypothetical protein
MQTLNKQSKSELLPEHMLLIYNRKKLTYFRYTMVVSRFPHFTGINLGGSIFETIAAVTHYVPSLSGSASGCGD